MKTLNTAALYTAIRNTITARHVLTESELEEMATGNLSEDGDAMIEMLRGYASGIMLTTAAGETVEIGVLDSEDLVAGSSCACAMCLGLGNDKALIVVDKSFGELSIEEQVGMLGHECGHVYYGHFDLHNHISKEASAEAQTVGNRFWDHEVAADDFGVALVGPEVMANQLAHSEQLEAKRYEAMGAPQAWENADGRRELLNRIARLHGEDYERIEVGELTRKLAQLPMEELERRQQRVLEATTAFMDVVIKLEGAELEAAMAEHQRHVAAIMAGEEE